MEDYCSPWTYQMSMEDLRQQLQLSIMEIESIRREAKEQMRNNEERVKSLINMVTTANKERDEARDQLQKILNTLTLIPITTTTNNNNNNNKTNSSITESNSLGSSPVESLFDSAAAAVSSPEFSNFGSVTVSPAEAVIERLAMKRKLPEKGRLMQAVMEAGPLLTTLMVAGPLPQWRNPPPLIQSFGSCSASASASILSFGGGVGVVGMGSGLNDRFPMGKRQRLH